MSVPIDPVDLSSAVKGSTGSVTWTGLNAATGAPAGAIAGKSVLRLYNESGCGLRCTISGGRGLRVPAGGWGDFILRGEQSLNYNVEYVIPNAPISLLLAEIFEPGEPIPPLPSLGNSPIGISGTIGGGGTGTTFIKNDANAPATSIIESTPSDQSTSAFALDNDGSGFWKVLSASVLRTILNVVRGNATTGKAVVTLGDSGDPSILTVYGTVSQATKLFDTTNDTIAAITEDAGTILHFNRDFNPPFGGKIHGMSFFSGGGSGTFNHNLGVTPTTCLMTAHVNGSQTMGYDSETSTTVHVTTGFSEAWTGLAINAYN